MSAEIDRELMCDALFMLSKKLNKQYKNTPIDIYIVGGSSLILQHTFRNSTQDVDIIKSRMLDIKSCAAQVAEELDLEYDWINDNVMYSKSYSNNIKKFSHLYKKMYNLRIYTVDDICILCMKLIACRDTTHDLDDIRNLLIQNNFKLKEIEDTLTTLYGENYRDKLNCNIEQMINEVEDYLFSLSPSLIKETHTREECLQYMRNILKEG